MDELGVIGLIAGLWMALAQPAVPGAGRLTPYPVRLGWLLVGLSAVLILSGTLAPPSPRAKSDSLSTPACGISCASQSHGGSYPSAPRHGMDLTGQTGSAPG